MTICITCGHSTENCFCGEKIGGHPPEQRSAGWEERKMAFDTARDYFEEIKTNRTKIAELQAENQRLKAERDRLAAENELFKNKQQNEQKKQQGAKALRVPSSSPFSLPPTVFSGRSTTATIARLSNSSVYKPPQRNNGKSNGTCLVVTQRAFATGQRK